MEGVFKKDKNTYYVPIPKMGEKVIKIDGKYISYKQLSNYPTECLGSGRPYYKINKAQVNKENIFYNLLKNVKYSYEFHDRETLYLDIADIIIECLDDSNLLDIVTKKQFYNFSGLLASSLYNYFNPRTQFRKELR